MRISGMDYREIESQDGLKPIHLENLRRIVVLAGPNGSGKSRLLSRVIGVGNLHIYRKDATQEELEQYGHILAMAAASARYITLTPEPDEPIGLKIVSYSFQGAGVAQLWGGQDR